MITTSDCLPELERYYDTAPRVGGARAEDFGPLTLFVQESAGWPYYARPALGGDSADAVSVADVERVLTRQRELNVPESFEWVAETTPSLRAAAEAAGLQVHAHPLMVLDPSAVRIPAHPDVRVLGAADPLLRAAVTVPMLAFAAPGTAVGEAGPAELAVAERDPASEGRRVRVAGMIASGRTALAAAARDGVVLCSGQHIPVGDVTEVVGVGTLPSARRQGLALAVTAALIADALARGARTVFLSAGDEDVARVYARLGFRPVGTALIADRPL
ncbi:GNAT family N-acetyltransferase [Streptomyces sp. ISL-43]|uniref:GNAT family N-acetyltransferase n=1 Tax=Streptomyces sp. ISL-43 TaxID=2819183 RepID=UPI001BEA2B46|nr:GNAT family N-acetyltransferase [Streptomyces sp. ISL-43]MBT2449103.1 GNAT family N-acetyltransferase [Streptomyces sp. ISL-43]